MSPRELLCVCRYPTCPYLLDLDDYAVQQLEERSGRGRKAGVIMRAGRGRSLETDSMVVPPSSLPATGEMRKWWGP